MLPETVSWLQSKSAFQTPHLACASRFVVADLVLEVFLQDVSDGELLPSHVNAGHGVADVDTDPALVYVLHGERHSTDVTCHMHARLDLQRRMRRYKSIQLVLTLFVGVKGWGKRVRCVLPSVVIVQGLTLSQDISDVASVAK